MEWPSRSLITFGETPAFNVADAYECRTPRRPHEEQLDRLAEQPSFVGPAFDVHLERYGRVGVESQ